MFDMKKSLKYHFVGIGGIGMSALAQITKSQGHVVGGSDRRNDNRQTPEVFNKLESQGIRLSPQDGTGVDKETDFLVISSAVEEDNPDLENCDAAGHSNYQKI